MIPELRPYRAYKDSGVKWLGPLPEHWRITRNKFLFRQKETRAGSKGGTLLSLSRRHGLLPRHMASGRIASVEDLSDYRVCRPDDLVMNRMQAWSGMFAASAYDGVVSPDYCVFELAVPSETKFFEYLFKTPVLVLQFALRSKGIGSGFNRLYSDSFGAVPVPVPPVHEQTAIVRLLSYMDRRIRQYIRAKERLIGLLGEQKQATIHQAVTGKIDVRTSQPYPTYTDSGVEWLGQVPEHWNLVPLKWIARRYRTGLTPPTSDSKYYEDGGVPWYGPSSCGIREEVDTPVRCLAEVAFTNGAARFVTGPALLVVVIGATVGRMAIMLDNGSTNQQIVTFPLSCASVIPRFLVRQLRGSGP